MREEVVLMGAGGHAKVCIELLQGMGKKISFCIGKENDPDSCLGIPVLKKEEDLLNLRNQGYINLFVAVGSNSLRTSLAALAITFGYKLVNAISKNAIISPSARFGYGVVVMAGAVINADAVISNLAVINTGATIDHDCFIGESVHIAPQVALAGNVTVGKQSFLGIGSNVIPEIKIGEHVVIGAGSVVISNIQDSALAVGIPARIIKYKKDY